MLRRSLILCLVVFLSGASSNLVKSKSQPQSQSKPTVTVFTATWCGPCQRLKPRIKALAQKYRVTQYDFDKDSEKVREYGVTSVPCFFVFHNGKQTKTQNFNTVLKLLGEGHLKDGDRSAKVRLHESTGGVRQGISEQLNAENLNQLLTLGCQPSSNGRRLRRALLVDVSSLGQGDARFLGDLQLRDEGSAAGGNGSCDQQIVLHAGHQEARCPIRVAHSQRCCKVFKRAIYTSTCT